MSSKKDNSSSGNELRSPRLALPITSNNSNHSKNSSNNTHSNGNNNSSRATVLPPQLFQRYVDTDAPRDSSDDRSVFQRYVAETLSPSRSAGVSSSSCGSPGTTTTNSSTAMTSPRLAIRSPRVQQSDAPSSSAETTMSLLSSLSSKTSNSSPRAHTYQIQVGSPRTKPSRHTHVLRPYSPVGELPPESAIPLERLASPRTARRRAILAASDVDKITRWLESLARETKAFGSYFLYCEMLFRESRVLTQGKPTPNRLQTAVAFHCLCKATSVFARHEHVLATICRDLAAAIFVNHDDLPIGSGEIEALECFSQQLTYYDSQRQIEQQREHVHQGA